MWMGTICLLATPVSGTRILLPLKVGVPAVAVPPVIDALPEVTAVVEGENGEITTDRVTIFYAGGAGERRRDIEGAGRAVGQTRRRAHRLSNLYNMVIKFYLLWKLCEPEPMSFHLY